MVACKIQLFALAVTVFSMGAAQCAEFSKEEWQEIKRQIETGTHEGIKAPKPGSPAANFRDDALLNRATLDITKMKRHELDLLTDLLAICQVTGLAQEKEANRLCEIANQRFKIAYFNARPIDRILLSVNITSTILRHTENTKDPERRAQNGRDIMRLVDISSKLEDAISARNSKLDQ